MPSVVRKTSLSCLVTLVLFLTLSVFPSFGADSESGSGKDTNGGPENAKVAAPNPAYNDTALFIAGISNPQGALAASEKEPAWVKYARSIDRSWARFDRSHLAPMREWAARELSGVKTATVFYPFSGPDFVNMYNLFPHAKTYLMIALEPVGEIPDFSDTDEDCFFTQLQGSLNDILQLNFFITDKLKNSLVEPEMQGILPVLLFFLAREKARVLDVRYWVMKADGSIEESPAAGSLVPGPEDLAGVRCDFKSLQTHEKFVSFLKGFGPVTTFAKAASYLMHRPEFSEIRQFILEQSLFVLATDSAIPVKYFDRTAWNLKFFGTYTNPIARFKCFQQRDLAEIYRKGTDVYPLPFGISYSHRVNTSNLMFASKKVVMAAGDAQ
jgi:hypothetical protein